MQYDSLTYLEMRGGEGLLVYLHSFIPWGCCKHLSSTLLDEGPKVSNYNRTLIIISSDHFLSLGHCLYLAESELFNACAVFSSAKCSQRLCYILKNSTQSVGACPLSKSGLPRKH